MRNQPLTDALPPGWSTAPIGRLVEIRLGKMLQPEPTAAFDSLVPYLNAKAVRWDGINVDRMPEMWASPKDVEAYSVQAGDLLVCEGGEAGRSSLLEKARPGTIVQNSVHRLRPRGAVELRYVRYALCAMDDSGWLDVLCSRATIAHLTREKLASLRVPSPPLDDQRHISDFLDHETEKIDALVAKKQRLIELLQEKRTALISHAVTKGLDPEAPMKDSGIEWLGEAPSHWQAGPLRRFWNVIDCKHKTVAFLDEGVPVASIGEVQGITVDLSGAKLTSPAEANELSEGGRKPGRGDVIISRNATVGEAALVDTDQDFCLGQDVSLIRSEGNDQRYLVYLLQSPGIRRQIESLMIGSTFRRINVGRIKELQVLRPQKRDQVTIGRFCDSAFRTHSDAVTRVEAAIGVLSEYRSALITAAVTGQIDVGARKARPQAEGP